MMISKLKIFATVIVIVAMTLGGVQTFAQRIGGARPVQAPPQSTEDIKGQLTRSLAKIHDEEATLKASLARLAERKRSLELQLAALIGSPQPKRAFRGGFFFVQGKTCPELHVLGDLLLATSPGRQGFAVLQPERRIQGGPAF